MAIQLNERDHLIFKLIDEHQVLLEKHISWFISGDDKPVLIRDRLRKLFYLDYLLCHRHGTKLPWWTTPTKPLVYMLSTLTRSMSEMPEQEVDLFDSNIQRHLLEVANLRMLYLQGVKDGLVSEFAWTTIKSVDGVKKCLDAKATFRANNACHKVGIINHPEVSDELIGHLETAISEEKLDKILIISRDDAHQMLLQKNLASASIQLQKQCLFATHHELYKSGITTTNWQTADEAASTVFKAATISPVESKSWAGPMMSATPITA
jgi:hypothetical protein